MARRNDHSKEDLKELILEATKNIVITEGFSGLTARRLAKDIGYTPGTIYNFFGSMDGVIFAVNAQTLGLMSNKLSEVKKTGNTENDLKSIARLYLEFANQNRKLWLMVFDHALPKGEKSPEWYRDQIFSLFSFLENFLEPEFAPKERSLAARTLWTSVHGICYMEQTDKISLIGKGEAMDMIDYLIEKFLT